jgi:membrane protease YdiL (CAAX protease family)
MSPDARRTRRPRNRDYEAAESVPATPPARRETKGRARRSASSGPLTGAWALNPRLGFLLLVGVGLASVRLSHPLRLSLLWMVLLVLILLYAQSGRLKGDYSLLNVGRGALIGAVVALPFYLFARDFFYATASQLYSVVDLQVLLERAVFIVPLLEECYFRGVVQRERGLVEGAVLFGLTQALYFASAVDAYFAVIAAVVLGMVLAGLLYGYLYKRYGLTASIAGHVAVNFVLFVLPALATQIARWLA